MIQNKTDYIQEANRQLHNIEHYKSVDSDLTHKFNKSINAFLLSIHQKGHIDKDTLAFLTTESPSTPSIYFLPKIHKAGNPGRPIVSAIGSPTEKISAFVDKFLGK